MKIIDVLVVAAVISGVSAKSCNRGGVYCGSSLLRKGTCSRCVGLHA